VHQQQINLRAGETAEVHVELDPGVGNLVLHSNPRGA
jgi:hypothetical protein